MCIYWSLICFWSTCVYNFNSRDIYHTFIDLLDQNREVCALCFSFAVENTTKQWTAICVKSGFPKAIGPQCFWQTTPLSLSAGTKCQWRILKGSVSSADEALEHAGDSLPSLHWGSSNGTAHCATVQIDVPPLVADARLPWTRMHWSTIELVSVVWLACAHRPVVEKDWTTRVIWSPIGPILLPPAEKIEEVND